MLLAAEDLESIEATLELLADAQAQDRIRRSEVEFTQGDVLDEEDVRARIDDRHQNQSE